MVTLGSLLVMGHVAEAEDAPPLVQTALYGHMVQNCRALDLAVWQHPTRQVLRASRVPLVGVELCNAGLYPVFHVQLPYEVQTANNDRFYHHLYMTMFAANGFHPFALRDDRDKVIVEISGTRHEIKEDLETFR